MSPLGKDWEKFFRACSPDLPPSHPARRTKRVPAVKSLFIGTPTRSSPTSALVNGGGPKRLHCRPPPASGTLRGVRRPALNETGATVQPMSEDSSQTTLLRLA